MTQPPQQPVQVDTVIVGSGPSALILSYILHGHIPVYDSSSPHPDPILHQKLINSSDLLSVDIDSVTDHFYGSRFSYSTQALPVNVLLDTLLRPHGEIDGSEKKTCIRWEFDPLRAVSHIVLGDTDQAGGQWSNNPVRASWAIEALSYLGMLSLPGYTFEQYWQDKYDELPSSYLRPTRRDVAEYFATYPKHTGIEGSISLGQYARNIQRTEFGFEIPTHNIVCKHLVLASGIFTNLVPARPLLRPIFRLQQNPSSMSELPLLVIGSGFSAADVILSTPAHRKLIHIFKWAPSTNPSPLRACHQDSYSDYAEVYRKMKLAATSSKSKARVGMRRASTQSDSIRDWTTSYEGLPNTEVVDVSVHDGYASITMKSRDGTLFQRDIGEIAYVVGRRGSLGYLEPTLAFEICSAGTDMDNISGTSLREKTSINLELAPDVFVIGSLTGDSLVRFAYGACTFAAEQIISRAHQTPYRSQVPAFWPHRSAGTAWKDDESCRYMPTMTGLDGHDDRLSYANLADREDDDISATNSASSRNSPRCSPASMSTRSRFADSSTVLNIHRNKVL